MNDSNLGKNTNGWGYLYKLVEHQKHLTRIVYNTRTKEEENQLHDESELLHKKTGATTDSPIRKTFSQGQLKSNNTENTQSSSKPFKEAQSITSNTVLNNNKLEHYKHSLPPNSRSNLMKAKPTVDNRTSSQPINKDIKPATTIANGKEKHVNDKECKGPVRPLFKIPKFNRFSSQSKSSPNGLKSPKMDGETDSTRNSNYKSDRSSIRRSKVLEKLVQQQIRHKEDKSIDDVIMTDISNKNDFVDKKDINKDSSSIEQDRRSNSENSNAKSYHDHHIPSGVDLDKNVIDKTYRDSNTLDRNESHSFRQGGHELNRYSIEHRSCSEQTRDTENRMPLSKSNERLNELNKSHTFRDRKYGGSLDHLSNNNFYYNEPMHEDSYHTQKDHRANERSNVYHQEGRTTHQDNIKRNTHKNENYSKNEFNSNSDNSAKLHDKGSGYYSDGVQRESDQRYTEKSYSTESTHRRDDTLQRYYSDSEIRSSRRCIELPDTNGSFQTGRENAVLDHERTHLQPQIRTPLVTTRKLQLTSGGEDDRSRVVAYDNQSTKERMQDLEETVLSLKRVLNDREKELDVIKCEKRQLEDNKRDNRVANSTHIPVLESQKEVEKRINDLIREKENMATEIWQLRRDLDKASNVPAIKRTDETSTSHDSEALRTLQRKIDELENQIKDQEEDNETTTKNLIKSDQELDQLKRQNEVLRKSRSRRMLELEDENKDLKFKLERTSSVSSSIHSSSHMDSGYLRRETEHLREDLSTLRDKNHQLIQDNIKLTEHLKDLEMKCEVGVGRSISSSTVMSTRSALNQHLKDDERSELLAECQRYKKEREAALDEVDFLRKQMKKNRQMDTSLHSIHQTDERTSQSQRKNSGSDISDSTALLTSAHPGFHTTNTFSHLESSYKHSNRHNEQSDNTTGNQYDASPAPHAATQYHTHQSYDDEGKRVNTSQIGSKYASPTSNITTASFTSNTNVNSHGNLAVIEDVVASSDLVTVKGEQDWQAETTIDDEIGNLDKILEKNKKTAEEICFDFAADTNSKLDIKNVQVTIDKNSNNSQSQNAKSTETVYNFKNTVSNIDLSHNQRVSQISHCHAQDNKSAQSTTNLSSKSSSDSSISHNSVTTVIDNTIGSDSTKDKQFNLHSSCENNNVNSETTSLRNEYFCTAVNNSTLNSTSNNIKNDVTLSLNISNPSVNGPLPDPNYKNICSYSNNSDFANDSQSQYSNWFK